LRSELKKKCLLVVYLPEAQLPRFPDQMARFDFLRKNYQITALISSGDIGIELPQIVRISSRNPLLFAVKAALAMRKMADDYDFIYVIGVPAVMLFSFVSPRQPVIAYAPTHYLQHFGDPATMGLKKKLVAALKRQVFFRGMHKVSSLTSISRQLEELYRPLVRRVLTIPMGVDVRLYQPRIPVDVAPVPLRIVYAGSGGQGRGMELIAACARRLLEEKCRVEFHLIGCRDAMLEQLLKDEPALCSVIHLLPGMPYADVIQTYARMDVGLSLLESNIFYCASPPQKIFEYMAAGLPMICNRIVTHTDYIRASAVLVEYAADSLFDGIMEMLGRYRSYQSAAVAIATDMDAYSYDGVEQQFHAEIALLLETAALKA
jgi:glycosyltransferase involved in cell wall biosynthesis